LKRRAGRRIFSFLQLKLQYVIELGEDFAVT